MAWSSSEESDDGLTKTVVGRQQTDWLVTSSNGCRVIDEAGHLVGLDVLVVVLGILATAMVSPKSQLAAQQPACLHGTGEGLDQQLRKRQALAMTRQINSAEVVAKTQTGAYQPLENLSRVTVVAPGFVPHLAVDASGYAFSIKHSERIERELLWKSVFP